MQQIKNNNTLKEISTENVLNLKRKKRKWGSKYKSDSNRKIANFKTTLKSNYIYLKNKCIIKLKHWVKRRKKKENIIALSSKYLLV